MTAVVVREGARWARAVVLPVAALALVMAMHGAAKSVDASLPAIHAAAVWLGVAVVAAVWLAGAIVLAALQPRRDQRAAAQLQEMRVRTRLPDHALLCILTTVWASSAGQRVAAVNVRTGVIREIWLAECRLERGTYALVSIRQDAAVLVDSISPRTVSEARHHEERGMPRPLAARRHGTALRRERRAAAEVVRSAEALLKHS